MTLIPCTGCGRHVRASESACPFCGTSIQGPTEPRAMPTQRLGRAAVAAFGALVAVAAPGCGTASVPGSDGGTDAYHDDAWYGLGGDVYGAPPHDAFVFPDAGVFPPYGTPPPDDGGEPSPDDAGTDTGNLAGAYGAPPHP